MPLHRFEWSWRNESDGKAEVVCCVRLPGPGRRRVQEVTTHSTMIGSLSELANRLVELRVERVVMEATCDYWKPPFYLFEAHGLEPWLVSAKDVKHLPGRPKTDVLDSVWLCKVAERQMLDIFGVSGRAMMAALIAGQRDPKALARMARDSKNVGCVLSPPLTSTVVVAALLHRPSQPRRASSESEEHCRDDDHPPPGLHDSGEG